MRVATIVGARPQFIKASVVSAELRSLPGVREWLIHTGQHFAENMSEVFFAELRMAAPDVNLGIHGGGHGEMTGRMLAEIERILLECRPDAVLVYGDTNSTLAGALAAAKLQIPVAHVEAGLRSFNRRMPEEVNRVLTDHLSDWLFAPTDEAVRQLDREGIDPTTVYKVGDVMYDVALQCGERAERLGDGIVETLGVRGRSYVLATIHRAENTDDRDRLQAIVDGLVSLARDLPVVWPVHPRARERMQAFGLLGAAAAHLRLIEPQGYLAMSQLERNAAVIATDSGGVQKEAYFHRVPCVTLRDETEWVELVDLGWNRLVPPRSAEAIREAVRGAVGTQGREGSPYGDGHAARRIVTALAESLS